MNQSKTTTHRYLLVEPTEEYFLWLLGHGAEVQISDLVHGSSLYQVSGEEKPNITRVDITYNYERIFVSEFFKWMGAGLKRLPATFSLRLFYQLFSVRYCEDLWSELVGREKAGEKRI